MKQTTDKSIVSHEEVLKHLGKAVEVVQSWPAWKQEVLGPIDCVPKFTRVSQSRAEHACLTSGTRNNT